MKLKYNSTEVDRSKEGGFTPPKPGVYRMKIESCVYEAESSQGERIIVKTVCDQNDADGNGKGAWFFDYVGLSVDWKLDQWLRAIGYDTETEEEGEFDTSDFPGKTIMARVKEDYFQKEGEEHPVYRPKLAMPMPYVEGEDEEGWDAESEMEEVEEEPVEDSDDEAPSVSADDLEALGELADDEDEGAIQTIFDLCEANGIDSNEFDLWSEAAAAVAEVLKPPAKKTPAKKTAAKKTAAKPKAKPAEESPAADDDYDSWSPADLREELESRELSKSGSKTAMIARLRENDADPFS